MFQLRIIGQCISRTNCFTCSYCFAQLCAAASQRQTEILRDGERAYGLGIPLKLLPFYRFLKVELRRFGSGQQSELRIIGIASQLKDVRLKN
jgi:hypothetical protein